MSADAPLLAESRMIALQGCALDRLMPMHIWAGPGAQILRLGPSVRKMLGEGVAVGDSLFDHLSVLRPVEADTLAALAPYLGAKLKVALKSATDISFSALGVPLPGDGGVLLNLSPGAALPLVVSRFNLTLADFAPTDLTAEMLFLIEAKSSAYDASRRLNARLEGARDKAEAQALTDTLTGLKNRRAMDRALERASSASDLRSFGVMHIDLDYFKSVNDTLGHAAGDHVLMRVAQVLREETRREDVVARVGGDEFVVLLEGCRDLGILSKVADRIITRLEEPIQFQGETCRISASIGTTLSDFYDALIPEQLLSDADKATYVSKHEGRGRHTVFRPDAGPNTLN